MRLFGLFILIVFFSSTLFGQTALDSRIDFVVQEMPIAKAIRQLQDQSGLPIAFSSSFFEETERVSLDLRDQSIEQVLQRLLASTTIRYKMLNGQLVLFRKKKDIIQHTISGYLLDGPSGEKLVFATVYCRKNAKGTTSNEYGFYSLTLPPGGVDLIFNYVGSESAEKEFNLQKDVALNVSLEPGAILAEVIVESSEESLGQSVGFEAEGRIPAKFFDAVPSLGGESDVLRTAQMLPGVQTGTDGSGGMYIRGGEAGQNLILLDGVPVYNPRHLLGIFSVFNSAAVRSVHFLKGGFPARYGGGISSVFDIRTREGSQKKWGVDFGVGLFSARLSLDGPIIKDKLSVMVTARRSHSNFFFRPTFERAFTATGEFNRDLRFNFYDINTKLNFKLSEKDDLILSYYFGGDAYYGESFYPTGDPGDESRVESENELNWGNQVVSLRWNHQYNKKLFSNTTVTYSNYDFYNRLLSLDYAGGVFDGDFEYLEFGSSIRDYSAIIDFDYIPFSNHRIRAGAGIRNQENGVLFFSQDNTVLPIPFDLGDAFSFEEVRQGADTTSLEFYTTEVFAYLEDDFSINSKWKANLGLRLTSNFGDDNNFFRVEPRLSTHYLFNSRWSVQASLSRMTQYLHKVSFTPLQHPGDFWLPSVDGADPQSSWQTGLGINFKLNKLTSISIESYYKKMKNLLNIGVTGFENVFRSEALNDIGLVKGDGEAYGVELLLQRQGQNTGGWLSYSLAWSERLFPNDNEGIPFFFQYDSRHQLKLFLYHNFSDRLQLGLNWIYHSPIPYIVLDQGALSIISSSENINEEGELNTLRSTSYHRLDLNATYKFTTGNRFNHSIKLGVFNAYNRENVFHHEFLGNGSFAGRGLSPIFLFPILPSIQYGLKF